MKSYFIYRDGMQEFYENEPIKVFKLNEGYLIGIKKDNRIKSLLNLCPLKKDNLRSFLKKHNLKIRGLKN